MTANRAPVFSNANSITFEESVRQVDTRIIVQLAATDPDGDTLTFEILAGKDAAEFIFSGAAGALAFNSPVSFETPRDANGDNIYEVDVRVSDGTATATQTIRITVTNSLEGLTVRTLTSVAAGNGTLAYVNDTNQLLIVGETGRAQLINASSGAIEGDMLILASPTARVMDIAVDDLGFRNNNVFVLGRDGGLLFLSYANVVTGSTKLLWAQQFSSRPDASLGMRGSDVVVAIGDHGSRDAAQDPNDVRGNIILMSSRGDPGDGAAFSVTPRTIGWGLRSPRMPLSTGITAWPIDRGESFNEINQADFPLSQSNANFEWPIRDGTTDLGFTGTIQGVRVAPRITQEIGVNGAGLWLDAADSLQGEGWFGVWVISDDQGNIWTWDAVNDGPLEKRNDDFGISNPVPARAIISIDDGDTDVGRATPIFMLRIDGTILVADL